MNKKIAFGVIAGIVAGVFVSYGLVKMIAPAQFGAYIGQTHTNTVVSVSVGLPTTSTIVAASDSGRTCIKVWNAAPDVKWCTLSNSAYASSTKGFRVGPASTATTSDSAKTADITIGCGENTIQPSARLSCISPSGTSSVTVFTQAY